VKAAAAATNPGTEVGKSVTVKAAVGSGEHRWGKAYKREKKKTVNPWLQQKENTDEGLRNGFGQIADGKGVRRRQGS